MLLHSYILHFGGAFVRRVVNSDVTQPDQLSPIDFPDFRRQDMSREEFLAPYGVQGHTPIKNARDMLKAMQTLEFSLLPHSGTSGSTTYTCTPASLVLNASQYAATLFHLNVLQEYCSVCRSENHMLSFPLHPRMFVPVL